MKTAFKLAIAGAFVAVNTPQAQAAEVGEGAGFFPCIFATNGRCNPFWVNDGICDTKCFIKECSFDGDDCGESTPQPTPEPIATPSPTQRPTQQPVTTGGDGDGDEGGNGNAFNIQLAFTNQNIRPEIRAAFESAQKRWGEIITSDHPDITFTRNTALPAQCGNTGLQFGANQVLDDLLIVAKLGPIDGPGKVLGSAGPCGFDGEGFPRVGVMNFDTADLDNLIARGTLEKVILHEMGHVIGIGTVWRRIGLVQGLNNPQNDPVYVGENGIEGLKRIGGTGRPKVANTGGQGTRGGHWRESTYGNELMTGFLGNGQNQPLSALTVLSLKDMGYTVNENAAEDFRFNQASFRTAMEQKVLTGDTYGDDVEEFETTFTITPDGSFEKRVVEEEAEDLGQGKDAGLMVGLAASFLGVGLALFGANVAYNIHKRKQENAVEGGNDRSMKTRNPGMSL